MGEARATPHFNPLGLTGMGILEECSQHKSSSEEPIASKFEYIRAVAHYCATVRNWRAHPPATTALPEPE